MPSISDIGAAQDEQVDAMVGAFETHLRQIVGRAEIALVARLQKDLKTDADGAILRTPANSRLLRKLDVLFQQELDAEGYQRLVQAYVSQFPKLIPYFDDILKSLSDQMAEPIGQVSFSKADKTDFAQLQLNVADGIKSAVDGAVQGAVQSALFNFAGLKFKDLTGLLRQKLDVSISKAQSLADTGVMGFYRTVTRRGFEAIEAENQHLVFRYKYFGPLDLLNRPFCAEQERLAKQGTTRTLAEWDALDNGKGQPKPVSIWCGGYRCRHSLILTPLQTK